MNILEAEVGNEKLCTLQHLSILFILLHKLHKLGNHLQELSGFVNLNNTWIYILKIGQSAILCVFFCFSNLKCNMEINMETYITFSGNCNPFNSVSSPICHLGFSDVRLLRLQFQISFPSPIPPSFI